MKTHPKAAHAAGGEMEVTLAQMGRSKIRNADRCGGNLRGIIAGEIAELQAEK
jgi:hypothetical protein